MQIYHIPLSKFPSRQSDSTLIWKNISVERWADRLERFGLLEHLHVSRDGVLLDPPGVLEALRHLKSNRAAPPRGVQVVDGDWRVPVDVIDVGNLYDLYSLNIAGGVDHDFTPGATDKSVLAALLAWDDSVHACTALGIPKQDYELMLYELAEQSPEMPTETSDYGIPPLLPEYQATIDDSLKMSKWGSRRRTAPHSGTWHFYADDSKFSNLVSSPEKVVQTGAVAAVEPNFTIDAAAPLAVALYRIYQKRSIARQWQDHGLRLFVDLNVEPRFMTLNLLGVPKGWTAYMNRGYARNPEPLVIAYNAARDHAGREPLYCVYGGGKPIKALCERSGWTYIEEEATAVRQNGS